ncbi:VOC family protein [Nonomuraea spiralis]|uniref:VOC family protein n=1 Tax=Nonomuraea spiralis TaxID=46182 RepID=UPI003791C480
MIGHIGINVPDMRAAKDYYDALLPYLGFKEFFNSEEEIGYMPADDKPGTYLFLYPSQEPGGYSRHRTGLQHLAFAVRGRSAVEQAHAQAVALGSEVLHEPKEFPEYPPPYYAAFWLDPHGVMLEAVCHYDRD